jgi:hypothetical protein
MKRGLFSFLAVCLLFPFIVSAQRPDTSGSVVLFRKAMSGINPQHVSWVKTSANTVNVKELWKTEMEVNNMAEQYTISGALSGVNIDALAFLVMMQAAKDAQKELAEIMAEIKKINAKKAKISVALAKVNAKYPKISRTEYNHFMELLDELHEDEELKEEEHKDEDREHKVNKEEDQENKLHQRLKTAPTLTDLEYLKQDLAFENEALVEMGETESSELQMAKERRDKYLSIISNQLKKVRKRTTTEIIRSLK